MNYIIKNVQLLYGDDLELKEDYLLV